MEKQPQQDGKEDSSSKGSDTGVQNKRDFGSFHSSNVQELIELSKEEYAPPNIPIELPSFEVHVPFGSNEMKTEHFYLDDSWTFLNHGAFGVAIKQAVQIKQKWLEYIERQPVRFMDREVLPLLVYVIRELALFIDCEPRDVILTPNASHGVSTVIQCVASRLSPGDRVLSLNLTYGSTKKLLKYVGERYKIDIDELMIEFPLNDISEVVSIVSEGIKDSTKFAVIDHIASNQGIILPVKEIIELCHSKGIQVLVDGAHGLGMLPLSMRKIKADYYVSNAHKWLCCTKGCGFLYVSSEHHSLIRPLIVSHGFGYGFTSEFLWTGLSDFTSYLALLTVLQFWKHYKPESIRHYIISTAREGASILCKEWETECLSDITHFGGLILVRLPWQLQLDTPTYNDAENIQNVLHHKYKIEVPIKVIQGQLYVRISAHLYNKTDDYKTLAEGIINLCKEMCPKQS